MLAASDFYIIICWPEYQHTHICVRTCHQRGDVINPILFYSFASILYNLFVGSGNSNEVFSQLKRIHALMPYKIIRGILKISNPLAFMRAMLDLFLAQPFGTKSLLQR